MPGILVDTHWRMKPAGLCTPHTRNIGKLGRDREAYLRTNCKKKYYQGYLEFYLRY